MKTYSNTEFEAFLEKKAVYVANNIELKTAVAKKSLFIISTDATLYAELLKKFPKEKVCKKTKTIGKVLATLGSLITVLSFGLFAFVGVPMAAAGAALGITGAALDDYKDYELFMDYDQKRVAFMKLKGTPRIDKTKKGFRVIEE